MGNGIPRIWWPKFEEGRCKAVLTRPAVTGHHKLLSTDVQIEICCKHNAHNGFRRQYTKECKVFINN